MTSSSESLFSEDRAGQLEHAGPVNRPQFALRSNALQLKQRAAFRFLAALPVHRWLERLGLLKMSGKVVAGRLNMLTHFVSPRFAKHF